MMKMTKTEYAFEGSTDEFATVSHLFWAGSGVHGASDLDDQQSTSTANMQPMDFAEGEEPGKADSGLAEAAVKSFFERSPKLSKQQAAAIKAVEQAGKNGTTIAEVASSLNVASGSAKALFRLLGKRVRHTKEWPNDIEFFHRTWEGNQNRYVLRDEVRAFLNAGGAKL